MTKKYNGEIDIFFDELKECIPYKPRKKREKKNAYALWDFYRSWTSTASV